MSERPDFSRSPGFDQVVAGWGSDTSADLEARLQLVAEYREKVGNFTKAEEKIINAMTARLAKIKGM